jgi:hypothetical protein
VKEIQVSLNKRPGPLQRGDTHKNVKMGWSHLKISKAEFYMKALSHRTKASS